MLLILFIYIYLQKKISEYSTRKTQWTRNRNMDSHDRQ